MGNTKKSWLPDIALAFLGGAIGWLYASYTDSPVVGQLRAAGSMLWTVGLGTVLFFVIHYRKSEFRAMQAVLGFVSTVVVVYSLRT